MSVKETEGPVLTSLASWFLGRSKLCQLGGPGGLLLGQTGAGADEPWLPTAEVTSLGTRALVFPRSTLFLGGAGRFCFWASHVWTPGRDCSLEAQLSVKADSGCGDFLVELKELFSKVHWRLVKCST